VSPEVLQDPAVLAKMSDTKAAGEVKALEQFYMMLQCEPAKAFYGKKHVLQAAESQAIETLLNFVFQFNRILIIISSLSYHIFIIYFIGRLIWKLKLFV